MSPDLSLADVDETDAYDRVTAHLAEVDDGQIVTISGGDHIDIVLARYQIEHGRALDVECNGDTHRVCPAGDLDERPDFDVRTIPPQRRHEVLTAAFEGLDPGRGFVLVNDHDPKPLYHELRSLHGDVIDWEYHSRGGSEGWRIGIEKTGDGVSGGAEVHTKFDVREIPKAERHPTIHHRYGMIPDGEVMAIVAPHEPKPLYREFVDRYGGSFEWNVVEKRPGECRVHITKREAGTSQDTADASGPEATEELDVRHLPPAQRHEQIFDAYEGLDSGEGFVLVNDHDPKPLYHQFDAEEGAEFHWEYRERSPGEFRVLIGKAEGTGHRPDFDAGGHSSGNHEHDHGGSNHGNDHGDVSNDHDGGCGHHSDGDAPF